MEQVIQKMCIVWEVQIAIQITTQQMRACTVMQCTRRAAAVAELHRGTVITLTFLTRALLSSGAGAVAAMVRVLACSISAAVPAIATAAFRSVRSWSQIK